ncbi:glycosyl transferase family 90-domain-containing protein [Panaeolus papilionaceus]|nr:glycosyl transferase family 90-domain-containing protein [Panaeolus papilionaceus]
MVFYARTLRRSFRFIIFLALISILLLSFPGLITQRGSETEDGIPNSLFYPSLLFPNLSNYQLPFAARHRGKYSSHVGKGGFQAEGDDGVIKKHNYRSDGLLEVSEGGPHPIYELIARGEREWGRKLKKASRTLEEAVKEYTRRYNRLPPKGFDAWWSYVQKHDVQLPDEYDQIFHDIEPFWGLDPSDLAKIHEENETKEDTYTVGKELGSAVEVLTWAFREGRYDQLIVGSHRVIEMLNEVADHLPPFRMTLSPHDGPNRLSDYNVKAAVLAAAAKKTTLKISDLPRIHQLGWVSACQPRSPARLKPIDLDNPPPPSPNKTFIYDHILAMDPCLHPKLLHHHGQFLSHDMGPTPQPTIVPEFSSCSTTIHHNIRIPVSYAWIEDIYPRSDDPEWEDRHDERLLWRGTNTGIWHSKRARWQNSHRDFMMRYTNEMNGTVKVLPQDTLPGERMGKPKEYKKALVNVAMMDIAFGGDVNGCEPEVCGVLKEIYPYRERQSIKQAGTYKYVIDVDGNGWSGRFKRLITSNALVFKSTIYPEWYADRIAPWVHYVPVQLDLSDLYDALFFFRGDGNGYGAHDDLARKIAVAGREWSKTFWRQEDLVAYFFRLTLEYVRVMSLDRDAMTYSP